MHFVSRLGFYYSYKSEAVWIYSKLKSSLLIYKIWAEDRTLTSEHPSSLVLVDSTYSDRESVNEF